MKSLTLGKKIEETAYPLLERAGKEKNIQGKLGWEKDNPPLIH